MAALKLDLTELRLVTAKDAGHFRRIVLHNLDGDQLKRLMVVERTPMGQRARGCYVDPVESHVKRERCKRNDRL